LFSGCVPVAPYIRGTASLTQSRAFGSRIRRRKRRNLILIKEGSSKARLIGFMSESGTSTTPYDSLGGEAAVRRFVDRFYDLMESEPEYAALRGMHASDLAPMRRSLAGFLTGWLGGPRNWFEENVGVCVMSAHAALPISAETSQQWTDAMARALSESDIDADLATRMNDAFGKMAGGMARMAANRDR
jgi:hemoglobin